MKTRSRTRNSASRILLGACLGACLLGASVAVAAPPRSVGKKPAAGAKTLDAQLHAAYAMNASSSALVAGVALDKLRIPGLQVVARTDDKPDAGGIVLSFAGSSGDVRLLVHVAVCADAVTARKTLDAELRGISTSLVRAPDGLGDAAFSDDSQASALLVATQGNLFYKIDVLDSKSGLPTAAAIAATLRSAMVPGAPRFPSATLSVPPSIDARRGAPLVIIPSSNSTYKLRAEGGYIARGPQGPVLRPFAPGPITVHATLVDDLGRVAVVSAAASAR